MPNYTVLYLPCFQSIARLHRASTDRSVGNYFPQYVGPAKHVSNTKTNHKCGCSRSKKKKPFNSGYGIVHSELQPARVHHGSAGVEHQLKERVEETVH
jgi:hypothetical protein